MGRRLAAIAFLFALLAGAVALWTHPPRPPSGAERSEGPRDPAVAPPTLARAPPTPAGKPAIEAPESGAPPAPKVLLRGTVRTPDSSPVFGATVFVLPKTSRGSDLGRRSVTSPTDPDGRFTLATTGVAGAWIGAVKAGSRPAFVDGDAVTDPSRPLELVLGLGGTVIVSVRDAEGKPVAGVYAGIEGVEEGHALPVPGSPFSDGARAETDAEGEARVMTGATGPVRAWVGEGIIPGDRYADPAEVVLPAARGRAEFTLHPSCVALLKVTAAETGKPLVGEPFQAELLRDSDDALVERSSIGNAPDGEFEFFGASFRPGAYRLAVTGPGRRPWRSPRFVFNAPGETVEVRVSLELDPEVGDLILVLSPATPPAWGVSVTGPYIDVCLRRVGDPKSEWEFPPAGMDWDPARAELRMRKVRAGAYDALIWDGTTKGTGAVANARVLAGVASRSPVSVNRGVFVRLAEFVAESGDPEVSLRSSLFDRLPLVRLGGAAHSVGFSFSPSGGRVGRPTLGPYPFESVTVTLVEDGRSTETVVPGR